MAIKAVSIGLEQQPHLEVPSKPTRCSSRFTPVAGALEAEEGADAVAAAQAADFR
jgi:hypothetical protein